MNVQVAFAAFENTSLAQSVTDALRRSIIAGEFLPEQRLSEISIAERFGVARITAKAAIDKLAAEGMLRRGQRKTAYVPLLSSVDVSDLYLSREPVEAVAVEILARNRQVPPEAAQALAKMERATAENRAADHTEADISLHRALVAATGSARLRRMHDIVMGETQLCIAQVRRSASLDLAALTTAHTAILKAIAAGDPRQALAALLNDLHGCRDMLMAAAPQPADLRAGKVAAR